MPIDPPRARVDDSPHSTSQIFLLLLHSTAPTVVVIMTANQLYPAKSHAKRTGENLKDLAKSPGSDISPSDGENGLIYLASPPLELWPYSDQTVPFRQNRYFNYLSGVHDVPGCHVIYDIQKDYLTLYLPPIDEDDVMWSGLPMSPEEALKKYNVDTVKYESEIEADIKDAAAVLSIESSKKFPAVKASETLKEALDETRLIKDDFELDLMRRASAITDKSHLAVMSALPIEKNEGHIHAEFVYHSMRQGSKNTAYDPICCSGTNCGTLHYVKNDEDVNNKLLVLIDAGAEWKNYAADVTRTFPINGEWTKESRAIYDAVSDMHQHAMEQVKPGARWEDIHILTHKILVEHFLKLGIFKNGTVDEIMESRISTGFYPHGLGHTLGMDTHDTGGRANYEDPDVMLRYLRIRRSLQENMMVTVEPGIYFNHFLIDPILKDSQKSKYVDTDVLDKYWTVGGVRIEDDVLVTKNGNENFTKITKDADEISKIVKKGIDKGEDYFHNIV